MSLFDSTNVFGGSPQTTQRMSNEELRELRTLPEGIEVSPSPTSLPEMTQEERSATKGEFDRLKEWFKDEIPSSYKDESTGILYILSHIPYSEELRFVSESETQKRPLPYETMFSHEVGHPLPIENNYGLYRGKRMDSERPLNFLPVFVYYEQQGLENVLYAEANRLGSGIIAFNGILDKDNKLFEAITISDKGGEMGLEDVPDSYIRVYDPSLEGMTVKKCVSYYLSGLTEPEKKDIMSKSMMRNPKRHSIPEPDQPEHSKIVNKP